MTLTTETLRDVRVRFDADEQGGELVVMFDAHPTPFEVRARIRDVDARALLAHKLSQRALGKQSNKGLRAFQYRTHVKRAGDPVDEVLRALAADPAMLERGGDVALVEIYCLRGVRVEPRLVVAGVERPLELGVHAFGALTVILDVLVFQELAHMPEPGRLHDRAAMFPTIEMRADDDAPARVAALTAFDVTWRKNAVDVAWTHDGSRLRLELDDPLDGRSGFSFCFDVGAQLALESDASAPTNDLVQVRVAGSARATHVLAAPGDGRRFFRVERVDHAQLAMPRDRFRVEDDATARECAIERAAAPADGVRE